MKKENNGYTNRTEDSRKHQSMKRSTDISRSNNTGISSLPRSRRRRNNFRVYINQLIAIALCMMILWGSAIALIDALQLFLISDEITSMGLIPNEPDHPNYIRYQELLDNRVAVQESSWIGALLVKSGSHWLFKVIRIMVLLGIAFILIPYICGFIWDMIISDIKHFVRVIARARRATGKPVQKKIK